MQNKIISVFHQRKNKEVSRDKQVSLEGGKLFFRGHSRLQESIVYHCCPTNFVIPYINVNYAQTFVLKR